MADLKTYASSEVVVVFGAIPISELGGYDEGEFLTIEENEDKFTLKVGTDGEGVRNRQNNNSALITIKVMQTSAANGLLSALHALDKASGAGIVPFYCYDPSGTALHTAAKAWIKKGPPRSYSNEAQVREWVIETHDLKSLDGGFTLGA